MNAKLKKLAQEVLKPEHMPNRDMQVVAKDCGIEVAISLMFEFPGIGLYIPKGKAEILRKIIILGRKKNFGISELARNTGYSQRQIYRILKEEEQ